MTSQVIGYYSLGCSDEGHSGNSHLSFFSTLFSICFLFLLLLFQVLTHWCTSLGYLFDFSAFTPVQCRWMLHSGNKSMEKVWNAKKQMVEHFTINEVNKQQVSNMIFHFQHYSSWSSHFSNAYLVLLKE